MYGKTVGWGCPLCSNRPNHDYPDSLMGANRSQRFETVIKETSISKGNENARFYFIAVRHQYPHGKCAQ